MSTEKQLSKFSTTAQATGLLTLVLWIWPVRLLAFLLVSGWLVFLLNGQECFFWSDQGALHSQSVMNKELGYLSADFTQSLIFLHHQ